MKKAFLVVLLLTLLIFTLFAVSGWYWGREAEKSFKSYLQNSSEISARKVFRLELQDYQKTLFGARARLKISSDIPSIAEKIGEIELIAKLLNGPVFITKRGVSTGVFRWFITVDKSRLTGESRENLRAIFPDLSPWFILRADFSKKLHYSSFLQTDIGNIKVVGIIDPATEDNKGKAFWENAFYKQSNYELIAEKVTINYQRQKRNTPAYTPGNTQITIPMLKIRLNSVKEPIELKLEAISSISQIDGFLNGYSKIKFELLNEIQFPEKTIPIDKIDLSVMLKGISSQGFLRYSELQSELDNLNLQAQWSLQENGEFPEGQDQIWQLYNEIDENAQLLPTIIVDELLNKDSLIQFKAEAFNSQSNASEHSELAGILTSLDKELIGSDQLSGANLWMLQDQKSLKKGGGGLNTLLSNIQGNAQVNLESKLFLFLQNFSAIRQSEFKLILKDSKLLMR